jgi:uncharacterized protein (DUF58 family)
MTASTTQRYNIKRLELRSSKLVSGNLLGRYRSAFRGSGMEYADLREYNPGDDVKHIHWKATARSTSAFVKSFREERQLRVLLAVDTSASMRLPAQGRSWSLAVEFCSLIGALTLRSNDLFGLMTFSDSIESYTPTRSGSKAYSQALATLLASPTTPRAGTNLSSVLTYLSDTVRKATVIFIVSDFATQYSPEVLRKAANRHDIILVQMQPPIPPEKSIGIINLIDPESGKVCKVDTSSKKTRAAWIKSINDHRQELAQVAAKEGAAHITIGNDILQPLQALMNLRSKRIAR